MATTSTRSNASTTNSFDQVDSLIAVPASSRKEKLVLLGAKVLETEKEARKVLPEEKYVGNLEKLIVRDYFPELPKLKAQAEYMEAVSRNDHLKIRELQIRYSTRRTDRRTSPSQRPSSVFDPDTPGPGPSQQQQDDGKSPYANVEGDNESLLKKKKKISPLDKLTVQTYLDKYTSEDNASFEELAELHNKRERVKNSWMYDAEKRHNESLVCHKDVNMIEAADEQLVAKRNDEVAKPFDVDNWTYKARNAVLFNNIEEAPLTMEEYMERVKRNEKIINKEATRFKNEVQKQPHQAVMARAIFQRAANNPGHVDITGKELGIEAKTLGLVATPTPAPGVDDSPFMTWGEIEGTPFRLDAPDITPSNEDAPQFKIPAVPVRERVAEEIAEQIAQRYRNKRKHAMDQIQQMAPKTPKFNSIRSSTGFASMSPAAHRLAVDKLGIRLGTDKLTKVSPSPSRTPSSRATNLFSPAIFKMVKVKSETKSAASTPGPSTPTRKTADGSVTDNLLRLPSSPLPSTSSGSSTSRRANANTNQNQQRPSATDFF